MRARYPRRSHVALLSVAVVATGFLLVLGAGCHGAGQRVVLEPGQGILTLSAEANSETQDPFLGVNAPEAGPAVRFLALTSPSDGTQRSVNALQNRAHGSAVVFQATTGLPETIFLDVNKPVVGTFYISNAIASASGQSVEAGKIRVELWSGQTLIGGSDYERTPTMGGASAWSPFHYRFRPEAHNISAGSLLQIHVRPISGLADFMIGTAGNAQSFLEVHYFRYDPLSGALYADRPSIPPVQVEGQAETDPKAPSEVSDASSGLILALQAGAIAPLVLMSRRRRRPPLLPLLLAAIVLSAAFSGCFNFGKKTLVAEVPDEDPVKETVNITFVEDTTLATGKGAIEGRVGDEYGRIVEAAQAILVGTNHATKTAKDGTFRFSNLSAGVYRLHLMASKDYKTVEENITVLEGKTARLKVTMPLSDKLIGDTRPHRHDDWGTDVRKPIQDIKFTPSTCVGVCAETPAATTDWICDSHEQNCQSAIPIDTSQTVLPGTGIVEIIVNWQRTDRSLQEIGIAYTSPASPKIANNSYMARGPGVPFHIAVYPNEADPGHQKFTNWQFYVEAPKTDLYAPWGGALLTTPPLSVEIFVHKVVIPYEPPHNASELWGGLSEVPLFVGAQSKAKSVALDLPQADVQFTPEKSRFVLAETVEIRGTLSWVTYAPGSGQPYDSPQPIQYGLSYKPANEPAAEWRTSLKAADVFRGENSLTFVIRVDPIEIDQFYQQSSYWMFFPTDDQQPIGPTTSGTGMQGDVVFTLDANIIRGEETDA